MDIVELAYNALTHLDSSPRQSLAMANEAHHLAYQAGDQSVEARTALALATVLNRLGDYRAALTHATSAYTSFHAETENELWASSACELAWAHLAFAQLDDALDLVKRVRGNAPAKSSQAYCDRIEARGLRERGRFADAIAQLHQAMENYASIGATLDAARCERDVIHIQLLTEHVDLAPLDRIRVIFVDTHAVLDIVHCDFLRGLASQKSNHFGDSTQTLLQVRQALIDFAAPTFAAECDLELGINYRRLNQFEASLAASRRARDYFLANGITAHAIACSINLANTLFELNRYDEARALYDEALQFAQAHGRRQRIGILYMNLALINDKQGRYIEAIDLYSRSLQILREENRTVMAAQCEMNLAATYLQLGQMDEASKHLHHARTVFAEENLPLFLAEANLELVHLLVIREDWDRIDAYLEQAREIGLSQEMDSLVAVCDRLASQVAAHDGDRARALELVEDSRATFLRQTQLVDAALCDLIEGELHVQWQTWETAEDFLTRAQKTLETSFPDQAWRTHYGLSRCAAAQGRSSDALAHALTAVHSIARARATLVAEQFSNDFFAERRNVYDDALMLAYRFKQDEQALKVIEAGKARTFLTLLENRGWVVRRNQTDPYIADLIAREKNLRHQIAALRKRMVVQATYETGEPLRGKSEIASVSAAALQELDAVSQAYESVVTQLRLSTSGLAGISIPGAFVIDEFRQAMNAQFHADWCALDYYLSNDTLTIAVVQPNRLSIEQKKLSTYDLAVLSKCVSSESDLRELIYRGTLHGQAAPAPSTNYLRHLYRLLMPVQCTASTLIISPHGSLHALPFHALLNGNCYLVEQSTVVYTPNLQSLHRLLDSPANDDSLRPLALGLAEFSDSTLRRLPSTESELALMKQIFAGRGEYWWRETATRQKLFTLNTSGELRKFNLLHFATHAILDHAAPHRSHIVLYDEPLTTTDLLDLSLKARLVTLSACHTALGQGGHGDELIGLARAFFYAGVQALVGTLWSVEDGSAQNLMEQFYRYCVQGRNFAEAMRLAQCDLIRDGCSPFQWAPFELIGKP